MKGFEQVLKQFCDLFVASFVLELISLSLLILPSK